MEYEARLSTIAGSVWSAWTCNGRDLDEDMIYQTKKSAHDAACNAYQENMSDADWHFAACMDYLTR